MSSPPPRLTSDNKLLETKYQVLFENTSDAIFFFENGHFNDCNGAAFSLMRYSTKEEFLKCSITEFLPENQPNGENSRELVNRVEKIAFEWGTHYFECVLKRKDGTFFPAEVLLTARTIDTINFLYVVIRDISKRRQFLEELQVSESRFRALFEENPLGIAYHQLLYDEDNSPIDYIYLDHNRRFSEMTTFGTDITGKTILDIRPDFFTQYEDLLEKYDFVVKTGRTMQFETYYEDTNSWFEITAYRPQHGCFVSLLKDITERKKVELALNISEEKHRAIYDTSHDAIMILNPFKEFLDCNIGTLKLFGINDKSNFIGVAPAELSPEFQPDGHPSTEKAAAMMQIAMDKGSHFFEWTHRRLDGEDFAATVLLNRMELQGRNLLQARVHDISFLKKSEADRTRLNEILEMTSDFVSTADANENLTYINPAGRKLLGLESTFDIRTLTISDFHPDWAFTIISQEGLPTAIKTGIWRGETALLTQTHEEIPVSQVIMIHRDTTGKINYLSTIIRVRKNL